MVQVCMLTRAESLRIVEVYRLETGIRSLVTTVKTAPLFSNKTQNGSVLVSTTSCSIFTTRAPGSNFEAYIAPSPGHCISGSRLGVFRSIVFTLILHATPV